MITISITITPDTARQLKNLLTYLLRGNRVYSAELVDALKQLIDGCTNEAEV